METQIQIQANDPKQLDGLTPQQLVAQIREISEQYQREVPGRRRHWPESIRSRILALGRLGVPESKIVDLTGIPRATVFLWCRSLPRAAPRKRGRPSAGKFVQVGERPTVKPSPVHPTVGSSDRAVLVTPDGFRVEVTGVNAWGGDRAGLPRAEGRAMSLRLKPDHRIFVFSEYIDLRAGFDKLSMLVRERIGANLVDGDLYLFFGRDRRKLKAICYDGTGVLLFAKRMERGRFMRLEDLEEKEITSDELDWLLRGSVVRRAKFGSIPVDNRLSPANV